MSLIAPIPYLLALASNMAGVRLCAKFGSVFLSCSSGKVHVKLQGVWVQAAVHDCLGDAIGQYCCIVGQDSSDKEDLDSVTDGCTSSLCDSDSDAHAAVREHSKGQAVCSVKPALSTWSFIQPRFACLVT